ncbi:MAG: DPP IV N-terminal domain-containing protein, partial [Bacteroidetes bacterium]|nr:DPP IV N-terminal domain-containing protein [Bacteroidota bacterium]
MLRRLPFVLVLLVVAVSSNAQQPPELTVDMIMQNPDTWIGAWPTEVFWTDDGEHVYFRWNPQGEFESDSLFKARVDGGEAIQLSPEERRNLPPRFDGWHADRLAYDPDFRQRVFERDGDLFIYYLERHETVRLTRTSARESNPRFSLDGRRVIYREGDNLFARGADGIEQLTDIREGSEPDEDDLSEQDAFLEAQQTRFFDVLRERARRDSLREEAQEREDEAEDLPPTYYVGDEDVGQLQIAPAGRFVTFVLGEDADAAGTQLTNFVTRSGYAEEITARPKVGSPSGEQTLYVQDLDRDTTYAVDLATLPGAFDAAEFLREQGIETDSTRKLYSYGPYWSPDGRYAVLDVRSSDNKHRWIALLNPEDGTVASLDHQHDDAWMAGPGISWWGGRSDVGWMADNQRFWFQSEELDAEVRLSGVDLRVIEARFGRGENGRVGPGGPKNRFSHLWVVNVESGEVEALTSGAFEVSNPQLSRDGGTWYFQSSEGSPHERHVYRMDADGGGRTRLTRLPGRNDFVLSPDEEWLGLMYSQSNRPPEVVLEPARPMAQDDRQVPIRYLTASPTEDWLAYPWRDPEIIRITASDGVDVPARIYRPENPNGAAVLFVHGAGYLQNVHRWWSGYYREYQFHNLLADRG